VEPIRLIRDEHELQTTVEFEFRPGNYFERFWPGSVHLVMEVFSYVEPLIRNAYPGFDYVGPNVIPADTWLDIIGGLEEIASVARKAQGVDELCAAWVGFETPEHQAEFEGAFQANAEALADLSVELADWLRDQLRNHAEISLLGV